MPVEVEVSRKIDPVTKEVIEIITHSIDENGDFVSTTTTYVGGRKKTRTRETRHQPAGDKKARFNLVKREILHYAEDGETTWMEIVERFGEGVNETPLDKAETEYDVDPANNKDRWMRFVRLFTWNPGPPARWEQHTTIEYNENGTVKRITHP